MFDADVGAKDDHANIVFPSNVSVVGSGPDDAGTTLASSEGYTFSASTASALAEGSTVANVKITAPVSVGSATMGSKATGSYLQTKFQNVSIRANDLTKPALSLIAGDGDDVDFTFQDGTITHLATRGTALSQEFSGTGKLTTKFSGHTVSAANGVLSNIVGSDNANLVYTSRNGYWNDSLALVSPSAVSAFIVNISGFATAHKVINGEQSFLNTIDGVPCADIYIGDNAVSTSNHSNGMYTSLGSGVYTKVNVTEHATQTTFNASNTYTLKGAKSETNHGSSKTLIVNKSGCIINYTGTDPLLISSTKITVTGTGGFICTGNNNNSNLSTASGIPAESVKVTSDAGVSMVSNGSSLTNPTGSGYSIDVQGAAGNVSVTRTGCNMTTNDACESFNNGSDSGTLNATCNCCQMVSTAATAEGIQAANKYPTATVIVADEGPKEIHAKQGTPTTTVTVSSTSLTAAAQDAVGIYASNSNGSTQTITGNNLSFNNTGSGTGIQSAGASVGTGFQSVGTGAGTTTATFVGTNINKLGGTFIDSSSTGTHAAAITTATTAIAPDSGLTKFSKVISDSESASSQTHTGFSFFGDIGGGSLISADGPVINDINQANVTLKGVDDRIFWFNLSKPFLEPILEEDLDIRISSIRLNRSISGSTTPLMEVTGDGSQSVTLSDVTASVASGPVGSFNGLSEVNITLSNLETKDPNGADLLQFGGIVGTGDIVGTSYNTGSARLLSTVLKAATGHAIRTFNGTSATLSAVTSSVPITKSVYQNDGGMSASVSYGQNCAFGGSTTFTGAVLNQVSNTPTTST
jgi:hypothetical protein